MTQLALFDLDHTLLPFDSDYEWGQFLVRIGVVDGDDYAKKNERFYQDYKDGKLNIQEFLRFALKPLSEHSRAQLKEWHDAFMQEVITGQLRQQAVDLVKRHQDAGDLCCPAHFIARETKLFRCAADAEIVRLLATRVCKLRTLLAQQLPPALNAFRTLQDCELGAVQIFGGYGYTKDFPVEKFYRDSKLCTIGEGTSEIQKLVISRNILK